MSFYSDNENFIKKEFKSHNIKIKDLSFSFKKEEKSINVLKNINLLNDDIISYNEVISVLC